MEPSWEAHQGASGANPDTCKEDPRPMIWSERPWHPGPAQHDNSAALLGETLDFAQWYKTQATLSVKKRNQKKMPASDKHMHGDSRQKTLRGSPKRPHENIRMVPSIANWIWGKCHTERAGDMEGACFAPCFEASFRTICVICVSLPLGQYCKEEAADWACNQYCHVRQQLV